MESKMIRGIRKLAHGAMDVQSEFTRELIATGMPPDYAITAGNRLAKQGFDQRLEKAMSNASASVITQNLAEMGSKNLQ
jgi:hypothetical protein